MNTTDWKIAKPTKQCSFCDRTLAADSFFSTLSEDAEESLVRRDYCAGCWEQADRASFFSFWKARPVQENRKKRRVADDAVVLEFFWQLEDADTEQKLRLRFAMALYLLRRKLFKLREIKRSDGSEKLVLSFPRQNMRNIEVLSPELSEEAIAQATQELKNLLDIEL